MRIEVTVAKGDKRQTRIMRQLPHDTVVVLGAKLHGWTVVSIVPFGDGFDNCETTGLCWCLPCVKLRNPPAETWASVGTSHPE